MSNRSKSSLAELLASLSEPQRLEILKTITDKEATELLYTWEFWARPEQLPPKGDWFCWFLRSGRGYGKTRTGAEWVIDKAKQGIGPIALVGQTKADVRDTMIELGESSILAISPPWFRPEYEPSKRRVIWPNGVIGVAYSGDEPDQLRGPQHAIAWVDEFAKFKYPEETWNNLKFGLRVGKKPQIVVTTTPRPIEILKKIINHPSTVDVRCHTYDNVANLSEAYLTEVIKPLVGTRLGRQEIEGHILEDNPDALWKMHHIEANRVTKTPELKRVVIAVDPAVTLSEESAETGIIAAGLGKDGHGYVLEDLTLKASPHGWGSVAVAGYNKYRADRIVGEINNGGEMVEYTLRTIDPNISYKSVHASRGKVTRAEPIAALYEQGKVHHVGVFAQLEDQMTTWVPGEKSPDRIDALVWALTELILEEKTSTVRFRPIFSRSEEKDELLFQKTTI